MKAKTKDSGKLRIGDDWNAIRIVALSQMNPLKAIAEFVENSIDAHAKTIAITRGKEHNAQYTVSQRLVTPKRSGRRFELSKRGQIH